jgi:hypothetical protein
MWCGNCAHWCSSRKAENLRLWQWYMPKILILERQEVFFKFKASLLSIEKPILKNEQTWKKQRKSLIATQNLCGDICSSSIYNCYKREAAKMLFRRWVSKCGTFWQRNSIRLIKEKWAIKPRKDMKEIKMHIARWKKSQSKKTTHYMIGSIGH